MKSITTAVNHRDYHFSGANVSVEVYRDRVEISDPGELPPGIKPEDMGKKSVRRNKLLADLFHRIGEVEKVGSGILRMKQSLREAEVPPMRFEFGSFYTAIFDRITEDAEKTSEKIINLILQNKEITIQEMAELIGITERSIERSIHNLQQKGKIKRVGPAKGGHWEVIDN